MEKKQTIIIVGIISIISLLLVFAIKPTWQKQAIKDQGQDLLVVAGGWPYGDTNPNNVLTTAQGRGNYNAENLNENVVAANVAFGIQNQGKLLKDLFNGTSDSTIPGYPGGSQINGGVDDYNNNKGTPTDAYKSPADWLACNESNNYCGTGDSLAEAKDLTTGLVWSKRCGNTTCSTSGSATMNWFVANNCKYPNGLEGDDGACNTHNEVACICVKHQGGEGDAKTGCEAKAGWYTPSQKQLMQAYIDGANSKLSSANASHWSSTTFSTRTGNGWYTNLANGYTNGTTKTNTNFLRCVRPAVD